jgi:hypothetical protein
MRRRAQIHPEILKSGARPGGNRDVGLLAEPCQGVRVDAVLHQIESAAFELQQARDRVRDLHEYHAGEPRSPERVIRIAGQHQSVIGKELHQPERTGADRLC